MRNSLDYSDALETVLGDILPRETEELTITKAEGLVLAEDICSDYNLPMCATSGPDGYAVKSDDIREACKDNPVTLEIIDTVRAGYLSGKTVLPGTAIRIMTGSVVPEGADCVVRFEDTDEPQDKSGPNLNNPTHVKIYTSQAAGTNMSKAGNNIKKDALVLPKNTVIGAPQLAALTAIGIKKIKVIRRPRIAIITTGDELIKSGIQLSPGKSYDSNAIAIKSMVKRWGGIPKYYGIVRDDEKSLFDKIQSGLDADAIITTGGVSKGDYDLVRNIIGKLGELVFFRIKVVPGAAFAFGRLNRPGNNAQNTSVPIFALSGPPQGCMTNFEILVRPAILKMRGIRDLSHPTVEAVTEEPISNDRPMNFIRWAVLKKTETGYTVRQNGSGGALSQMGAANSLLVIPGGTELKAGEKISVWPLDFAAA